MNSPEELAAAFAAALAARDLDAALELWGEEAAIVTATGETVRGRKAIGEALAALIDNGTTVQIELARTITAGEIAVGLGTLTLSGEAHDGTEFSQSSSSTVLYARGSDGRWRIALDAPWGLPAS